MQNYIRSEWGSSNDRQSYVIPNLLPKATTSYERYMLDDVRQAVYVGMMGERKGFDIFINIMCMFSGKGNVGAHVFAKKVPEWMEKAEKCDIKWVFHGAVKAKVMWATIRKVHGILLFTSRHENLPMVPLEAAFMNVLALSTPSGGLQEVVGNADVVIFTSIEDMVVRLKEIIADGGKSAPIPVIGDNVLKAGAVWRDMLKRTLAFHKNDFRPRYQLPRKIELIHVHHWNDTDTCIDRTYGGYIALYDPRTWSPIHDLESQLQEFIKRSPPIMDMVISQFRLSDGQLGYAYEPILLTQWNWVSCLPSVPILVSEHLFCEWKKWQIKRLDPDWVIPRLGLWANERQFEITRVHKIWFNMHASIVQNRDCVWGDVSLLHHDVAQSFRLRRNYNDTNRLEVLCSKYAPFGLRSAPFGIPLASFWPPCGPLF